MLKMNIEVDEEKWMSPAKFLTRLKAMYERPDYDKEATHSQSNALMEDLLTALGYKEGIEYLRSKDRWYA